MLADGGSILTKGGYFSLTPRPACYVSPPSRSVIAGGCRWRQVADSSCLSIAQMENALEPYYHLVCTVVVSIGQFAFVCQYWRRYCDNVSSLVALGALV